MPRVLHVAPPKSVPSHSSQISAHGHECPIMHGAQGPRPIISRRPLPHEGEARLCGAAAVIGALAGVDACGVAAQSRAAATGIEVTWEGSLEGGGGRSKLASLAASPTVGAAGADADATGAGAPDGAPPSSTLVPTSSAAPASKTVPAARAPGDAGGARSLTPHAAIKTSARNVKGAERATRR